MSESAVLRSYARILRMPKRDYDPVGYKFIETRPSEIIIAAADALDFKADALDNEAAKEAGDLWEMSFLMGVRSETL